MTQHMRLGRAFRSVAVWTAIVSTTFAGSAPFGRAADEGADTGAPTTMAGMGQMPVPVPPAFDATLGAGVGQMFSGCAAPTITNAIMDVGQTLVGAVSGSVAPVIGPGGECPKGPGFDPGQVSCPMLSPGGKFDPSALKKYQDLVMLDVFAAQCREGKLKAAQAMLQCLDTQAKALTAAIRSVQAGYNGYIDDRRNVITQVKALIEDRKAQEEDVNQRLNGSDSGRPGLRQVKQELDALTSSMHEQINGFTTQMRDLDAKRKIHDEEVKSRTMHLAEACFSGPGKYLEQARGAQGPCMMGPGAPAETLADHIVCIYQNNLAQKHNVKGNSFDINQAGVCGQKLRSVLNQMLAPPSQDGGKISTGQNGPALDSNEQLVTLADLSNDYGDSLAAFDMPGTTCSSYGLDQPISQYVLDYAGRCLEDAGDKVEREKSQKSSSIGAAEHEIKTAEDKQREMINTQLDVIVKAYSKGTDALTGTPAVFPQAELNKCRGETPQGQITCLTNAANSLQKIVEGGDGFEVNATIVALHDGDRHDPKQRATIDLSCNGIEKCIAKYEHAHKFLQDEGKRLTTGLTTFVKDSNQHIEEFTQVMAQRMSGASMGLRITLSGINDTLTKLGLGAVEIPPVDPEQLQQGEDGLYAKPTNILGLVGGQMNPPMLNVEGGIGGALTQMGQNIVQLGEEVKQEKTKPIALQAKVQECEGQEIDKLVSDYDKVYELNCGSSAQFCAANGKNAIDSLSSTIEDITQGGQGFGNTESTLTTGSGLCNTTYAKGVKPAELKACQDKEAAIEARGGTLDRRCQRILDKDYDHETLLGEADMNAGRCMALVNRLQQRADEIRSRRGLANGNAGSTF